MNTTAAAGIETTGSTIQGTCTLLDSQMSNVFSFCGKGLHYDWRSIVAAAEASDLDTELAQMGVAATLS